MLRESKARSALKAISYRVLIVILDFTVIYLLTGDTHIAIGFMIISNLYTTVAYFVHERAWNRIKWGLLRNESPGSGSNLAE